MNTNFHKYLVKIQDAIRECMTITRYAKHRTLMFVVGNSIITIQIQHLPKCFGKQLIKLN